MELSLFCTCCYSDLRTFHLLSFPLLHFEFWFLMNNVSEINHSHHLSMFLSERCTTEHFKLEKKGKKGGVGTCEKLHSLCINVKEAVNS